MKESNLNSVAIIFPNQLYAVHPALKDNPQKVILVEDSLFFGDPNYPANFHKQKLWLHRSSMKKYQLRLKANGYDVEYVDYDRTSDALRKAFEFANAIGSGGASQREVVTCDPTDFILSKRLMQQHRSEGWQLNLLPNPNFINSPKQNRKNR